MIAPHVCRVEGEGRFAIPQQVAAWIDEVAQRRPTVVVAFGNPYVIRQFPRVSSYLVTYGVGDDLERAAASNGPERPQRARLLKLDSKYTMLAVPSMIGSFVE